MSSTKAVERVISQAEIEKINKAVKSYGKQVDGSTRILTARIEEDSEALLSYPSKDHIYHIKGCEAAENFDSGGLYPELEPDYETPVFFNNKEARELDEDSNILIGEHGQVRDQNPEGWNIVNTRLENVQCYLTASRDVVKVVNFEDEEILLNIDGEKYSL